MSILNAPVSAQAAGAREAARQDNGQFGTQALAEADVDLAAQDDWDADYERAHNTADSIVSDLADAGELRAFLMTNGVPESDIPDDEEELDEKARDLAHGMASDAVNSGEVDEFITTWTGGGEPTGLNAEAADFELTPEQAYEMNRSAAEAALTSFDRNPDDELVRSALSLSALSTLSSLRAAGREPGSSLDWAANRLDLALKVHNRAELTVEWDDAFADLKAAGVRHDSDDPIAVRYREASNAVNHANRKLDFYTATGEDTSRDPRKAAEGLAGALRGAIRAGDEHLRAPAGDDNEEK